MRDKINILIVDDHAVVREGLKSIVNSAANMEVTAEAGSVPDAVALLKDGAFDVILLDLTLREQSGMELLKVIKATTPKLPVLILSSFGEDQYAMQALKAGADGYLNKESAPESLIAAVERVASGKKYVSPNLAEKLASGLTGSEQLPHEKLSDREFVVLRLIAAGISLVAIADQLNVSTKTVTTYRSRIMYKTGFTTNADLTRYALEQGLLN
jgi:two-component system, NarL family, invasion response regulator UvrY